MARLRFFNNNKLLLPPDSSDSELEEISVRVLVRPREWGDLKQVAAVLVARLPSENLCGCTVTDDGSTCLEDEREDEA